MLYERLGEATVVVDPVDLLQPAVRGGLDLASIARSGDGGAEREMSLFFGDMRRGRIDGSLGTGDGGGLFVAQPPRLDDAP